MVFFKNLFLYLAGRLGLEPVHVSFPWPPSHVKVYGEGISDINMIPRDTCEISHVVEVKFDFDKDDSSTPIVYIFHDVNGKLELEKSLSIGESHRFQRVVMVDFLEGP